MENSGLNFNIFLNRPEQPMDLNYRAIRIKVYKNGDQYDTGTVVVICRKRFKHWLTFLDFLTEKLNLMAPVHEFYRVDGLRIQHFEEIENGGSYVAVSQGPFIHKPYGLLPEDREKWNMDPKFESSEQSTLNSAESVDIYLKQRGYTSRTGLPFPFDGGVCVNHSAPLTGFGRNHVHSSNQTIRQHRDELKSEENNSKNDELLEKNNVKPEERKEEMKNFNSQSISHSNSNLTIDDTKSSTMNNQNGEQNDEILHSSMVEATNASVNKVGENDLCNEIATQNNHKPTVKEYDECIPAPVIQIPDSSRESSIGQDSKNIGSLGMMQTMNSNYYSLPMRNPEAVVTIVNDDALINASNGSVIIVNISTGQKKSDNVNNICNKSTDGAEITPSLVNNVKSTEMPSQNSGVKMTQLPHDTGTQDTTRIQDTTGKKIPMAIHISDVPSTGMIDRSSSVSINIDDQSAKTVLPKKNENEEENVRSFKINSKRNENNLVNKFEESQSMILEQNLPIKLRGNAEQKTNLEMKQNDQQVYDTSENKAKLNEPSRNLEETTSMLMQRSKFKQNFDNFERDKEDYSIDKNQSNHISVASGHKFGSKNERHMSCAVSKSSKIQESLTTDKNSHNKKRVTLATPSIVEMNLEMESEKAENFQDSKGQLKYSPKQTEAATNNANILITTMTSTISTTVITNTTANNTVTDITHNTAASRDVIMHTTIRGEKEIPDLQQKYQPECEMSFEADFTPRYHIHTNSTRMKTFQKIKTDLDLNMDIYRLRAQNNYDPDFKDYDFIQ
ncbi:unnamed protein product [Cercopithifilaria johnstoni]|uniref:Doublecortin domain-containing protein n=1 Tax=Cercopithifilaria johnstoni TaxID=2874296 RepID=A0A8J2M0U2_9BILA|nr:unnamed protein product [Cercopithifilaria johnstoni]